MRIVKKTSTFQSNEHEFIMRFPSHAVQCTKKQGIFLIGSKCSLVFWTYSGFDDV